MTLYQLVEALEELPRYDLDDDGGCGDPECCGSPSYYIGKVDGGGYIEWEDVANLIKEVEKS